VEPVDRAIQCQMTGRIRRLCRQHSTTHPYAKLRRARTYDKTSVVIRQSPAPGSSMTPAGSAKDDAGEPVLSGRP
jgi:hypothetical protein